jgi:hypothetical protein
LSGFDIEAALNGLKALVETIPSMEAVRIGAPESLTNRIEAWITVGDPGGIGTSGDTTTSNTPAVQGVYELDVNLLLWYGYAVEGAESAAEAQLADWLTGITRALILNRMGTVGTVTRNLNGTVDRMGLPQASAGISDYTMMAGSEVRTFPIGVRIIQREALGQ